LFYYTLNEKNGSHVFASSLTTSNTKRVNLTWLPLEILHRGHTWLDYPWPWVSLTWLLYDLQLDDVTGADFQNSLYAFGQSEKREWVQCIIKGSYRGSTNPRHSQQLILEPIIIHQIFSLTRYWSKSVTRPSIPQLNLGNIRECSPIFGTVRVAKNSWRIINTIAFIWLWKYARVFVLGHYLFLEAHSVHLSEQIMSADKYPSIFSRQMEAIVYLCFVWYAV